MTDASILVTGATGTVGSELVHQLVEGGHRVRALTRDSAKAQTKFGSTVEIVQGDLGKPETLGAAFAGVDKAYVLSPAEGPEFPELEGNAFDAAKTAGIKHLVKQSYSAVADDLMAETPFAEWHGQSEERLRTLGVAWTILRPAFFATNLLSFAMVPQGGLSLPTGDGKDAIIDPRDVAAAAVKVLTTPGHEGKTYELTGPELLSYAEVVRKAAAATGKPLKFTDVPEPTWREGMLSAGVPLPVVEAFLGHFAGVKAGRIRSTSTVADLLGRPARTLDGWLRENAAALMA